jgi:hypothetical protein
MQLGLPCWNPTTGTQPLVFGTNRSRFVVGAPVQYGTPQNHRPRVLTRRCWRLVSDHGSIRVSSTSRQHRFPKLYTSMSAWTGQRLVELQEDALAPNVQIAFDARRRYELVQLCMTNRGLSPAHDIKVEWDNAPMNEQGEAVHLGSGGVVPVLNPGEEASVAVSVAHKFFAMGEPLVFSGRLSFNDASGNSHSKQLVVSAEHERRALLHQSEEPKTLYELQKLPAKLDAIAKELRSLREVVDRLGPGE